MKVQELCEQVCFGVIIDFFFPKKKKREKKEETYLLHVEALNASPVWHFPFHPAGTGGMSTSLKLGDSGQIPVLHCV